MQSVADRRRRSAAREEKQKACRSWQADGGMGADALFTVIILYHQQTGKKRL